MRKSSNIIRAFDALTIVKGINSLGGPDKQVYYIESDVYAPDRRITPLLLQPYVNVSDPNGIITAGDKVSELVDGAWYVDSIDAKNRVTKSSVGSTLDDPFTIGENHLLMVRLNTDKSVMLFFEGDYYDSRKGSKIHISLSYMLSTTHNSQNKPAPKVLLSKGASYTYNPLDDLTELVIESQLADDGKLLRGAVEWCEVEGTKITAISNAMPYYISGQHSDKLKINPSLMGDVVIRARNVSEEFYNKVYGINPEWDGRMQEVFENMNLILKPYWVYGGIDSNGNLTSLNTSIRSSYYIPVESSNKYYVQLEKIEGTGKGYGVNFFDTNKKATGKQIWWSANTDKHYEFTTPTDCKYVMFNCFPALLLTTNIKMSTKSMSPYTPAPEDLNFRNLITNGDFRDGVNKWSGDNIKVVNNNTVSTTGNGIYYGTPLRQNLIINKENTYYARFNVVAKSQYCIRFEVVAGNYRKTVVGAPQKDVWYNPSDIFRGVSGSFIDFNAHFESPQINKGKVTEYKNILLVNLTQTFGKGNEPSKEQLDAVFANMDYIPSPQDIAPDGILPGTYQSDMKFTPLYPNIDANVVYLTTPVIKKGVERIKAQAVLSTNKKTITNPEKHFDIEWILKPTTAGGKETVVGTGEFVDIPVANLPEGRVIGLDLEYNFKKR